MKILQMPLNIASQISVATRSLRALGLEARGLAATGKIVANEIIEPLMIAPRFSSLQWFVAYPQRTRQVLNAIRWADVIHWHSTRALIGGFDLFFARALRKKIVVEFWGSDIRNPEIEFLDNPYYERVYKSGQYEYIAAESAQNSYKAQKLFATYQAALIFSDPIMMPYVRSEFFARIHRIRQRVLITDYEPCYPSITQNCPLIIHSPSAPMAKGSDAVKAAIKKLEQTHLFEFKLVQNMPHDEAKRIMQQCDIFVDQFVLGTNGLAALEAMAYGKPVVCYVKPSLVNKYPIEFPVVNATQETLPDVLAELIKDSKLRRELGERGRAYVEKYHDAHKLAQQLVEVYQSL